MLQIKNVENQKCCCQISADMGAEGVPSLTELGFAEPEMEHKLVLSFSKTNSSFWDTYFENQKNYAFRNNIVDDGEVSGRVDIFDFF